MKFHIEDFFSKCDQTCRKLQICSHLLEKFLNGKLHFLSSNHHNNEIDYCTKMHALKVHSFQSVPLLTWQYSFWDYDLVPHFPSFILFTLPLTLYLKRRLLDEIIADMLGVIVTCVIVTGVRHARRYRDNFQNSKIFKYMLTFVSCKTITRCKIYSKLTIKTPERFSTYVKPLTRFYTLL